MSYITCKNGPMAGVRLWLDADATTGFFTLHGETGRYVGGKWEAV